jgi:hypothetical protein
MDVSDHWSLRDAAAVKADSPCNGDASGPGCPRGTVKTATKRPRFPAAADPTQSWGMSCAQTAIIPTKSVMDASAAASSTNIFNMPASRFGT